jgi:hypothetical protein
MDDRRKRSVTPLFLTLIKMPSHPPFVPTIPFKREESTAESHVCSLIAFWRLFGRRLDSRSLFFAFSNPQNKHQQVKKAGGPTTLHIQYNTMMALLSMPFNITRPRLSITQKQRSRRNTLETQLSETSTGSNNSDNSWQCDLSELSLHDRTPAMPAASSSSEPSCPASPTSVVALPSHVPHRRCKALDNADFEELLCKSRGWMYDPHEEDSHKNHARPKHDRSRNLALTDVDFERFIFKPSTPRLGSDLAEF